MPSKVYSGAIVGVESFEVEIEVDAGWGDPDKIAVVGLPGTAVKESRDRVTSAIGNSGLPWSGGKRITINLAPADVRKEEPSFDLPIALGMLKLEEPSCRSFQRRSKICSTNWKPQIRIALCLDCRWRCLFSG